MIQFSFRRKIIIGNINILKIIEFTIYFPCRNRTFIRLSIFENSKLFCVVPMNYNIAIYNV